MLSLDHLLGSLITHEVLIGEDQSKKKGIVLKAIIENLEELDDDVTVILTRKFKQFFNQNSIGIKGELNTQKGIL